MKRFASFSLCLPVIALTAGACLSVPSDPGTDLGESTESDALTPTIAKPDLIEQSASVATTTPLVLAVGQAFTVSDTVLNQGAAAAPATKTKAWLSVDGTTKLASQAMPRDVAALAPLATDSGSQSVPVQALPDGDYFVLTCADAVGNLAKESNETNNCILTVDSGSSTLVVHLSSPNLVVSQINNPPSDINVGSYLSVVQTTANPGEASTNGQSSFTAFNLSPNGVTKAHSIQGITTPALGALDAGTQATNSVIVPPGTPGGPYYLMACADSLRSVLESNENDNCKASTTTVTVHGADLIESSLSIAAGAGGTMDVTDTVLNQGDVNAAASDEHWYLSTDTVHNSSDLYVISDCIGTPGRSFPALTVGNSSSAVTNSKLCYKPSSGSPLPVPSGTYYLFSCVDGSGVVPETVESNNCALASGTITVP